MFNDVGKKIKSVVKVLFVINIIFLILFCIVLGFGCYTSVFSATHNITISTIAALIITIIMFILFVFGVWISCLFYYAFGQVSESVEEQNNTTKESLSILKENKS